MPMGILWRKRWQELKNGDDRKFQLNNPRGYRVELPKRMLSVFDIGIKMELLKVFILIGRADVWMLSIN